MDKNYINSNEYRNKLDKIIQDANERRAVESAVKDILNHRTGTHFEDLAYIDTNSKQLKTIINKDYDYYEVENKISKCIPNKPMNNMLNESKEYTIIGIHNHPNSNSPSIADIITARNRKYKYGIVCCHDGKVYKYQVNQDFKDIFNCQINIEKLQKSLYNNNHDEVAKIIEDLSKIGIKIEVI